MTTDRLTVFVSSELDQHLMENSISVADMLREHHLAFDTEFGSEGAWEEDGRTRDLGLTILASTAVVATITPLVKRILESLTRRPVVVTELRLLPVESSSGEVMFNTDGSPILHWVKIHKVLDRSNADQNREEHMKMILEAPLGMHFELDSSSRDGDPRHE